MPKVISGGIVVTAAGRFSSDVRIENGRVAAVGIGIRQPGDAVLDASGCYVLPGAIDPHTHMELPLGGGRHNADTWYTGTVAAAFGGTTTVIDMITQERGGSLQAVLEDWHSRAAPQAVVDYGFHMGVIDPRPEVLAEIPAIASGVLGFKVYMAYRGRLMLNDAELLAVMRAAAEVGSPVLVHAENGDVIDALVAEAVAAGRVAPRFHAATRPVAAEAEATTRACRLAEVAGARLYVVHVTCAEALREIERARKRGQQVTAETCTHYLLFEAGDLARPGFEGAKWVLSPPLRTLADAAALWRGLGRSVEVVGSDHCPWTMAQKEQGLERFDRIPNGVPGVEERLPFLYTYGVEQGALTLEDLVAVTSANPARILGLYPGKGTISPGSDADLVVWDPAVRRTWNAADHHCGSDNTPYEGLPVHGAVRHVLVRGLPVIQDAALVAMPGVGKAVSKCAT